MEKFNITKSIKRELARNIKARIGNNDYTELAIMYVASTGLNDGYFQAVETLDRERLENEGQCYYGLFEYSKADGKITLKEIEDKIFL